MERAWYNKIFFRINEKVIQQQTLTKSRSKNKKIELQQLAK